jgi:signal transduction histidine kinase
VGGADARAGSGLVGLADRIQALGGVLEVSSPVDRGTRLTVRIPWEAPTSTEA